MKRKAKTWRGNSHSKIVGNVPGSDPTKAKWANQQLSIWPAPIGVFTVAYLLMLLIVTMAEVMKLRRELRFEKNQSAWYLEQLKRYAREKYMGKSAQTQYDGEQVVFEEFLNYGNANQNEMNTEANEKLETTVVPQHTRTVHKRGSSLVNILKGVFPEEIVDHFPEDILCPECQNERFLIGISEERRTLVIVPATVKVRVDRTYSYACRNCENHSTSAHVITAPMPKALIPGGYASPEAVAYTAVEKFWMGTPIYRQEKYFHTMGISLSRMTLNNWILESAKLLLPFMDRVHALMLEEDVLLGDETTTKYPNPEKKGPMKNGYAWMVCTCRFSEHQLVQFRFELNRKHENHTQYIEGFKGYFQSDGYECYHNLEGIISVGCMAHARQKFVDAVKDGRHDTYQTLGRVVLKYYDRILYLESTICDLEPEKRLAKRIEIVKPVTNDLKMWLDKMEGNVLPKSLLGKAIQYSLNQWQYMMHIFDDGRLDATNNRSERLIKDYVIARKNYLFVQNDKGGNAASVFSSLIAIAKLNNLDPYNYITWLLKGATYENFTDPKELDKYMPWNTPESMKVPALLKETGSTNASDKSAEQSCAS